MFPVCESLRIRISARKMIAGKLNWQKIENSSRTQHARLLIKYKNLNSNYRLQRLYSAHFIHVNRIICLTNDCCNRKDAPYTQKKFISYKALERVRLNHKFYVNRQYYISPKITIEKSAITFALALAFCKSHRIANHSNLRICSLSMQIPASVFIRFKIFVRPLYVTIAR